MKFLVIFALGLATAAGFSLRDTKINQRNIVAPVVKSEGRITNGQNATIDEFPYQVGLSLKKNFLISSWCGGSVIGEKWVLTAAHCTENAKSVIVYLGGTERTKPLVKYTVSSSDIIIHSEWNSRTVKNDISLIKTPSITFSSRIKAVKLPSMASSYSTYTGDKVIASGWGRTSDDSDVNNILQSAHMEVIPNQNCKDVYGAVVTPSNICVASINRTSTCQGDSGGPLVLEGSIIQVGLTSFGSIAGCEKGYPAAFTRTTSYLKWINEHTGI